MVSECDELTKRDISYCHKGGCVTLGMVHEDMARWHQRDEQSRIWHLNMHHPMWGRLVKAIEQAMKESRDDDSGTTNTD